MIRPYSVLVIPHSNCDILSFTLQYVNGVDVVLVPALKPGVTSGYLVFCFHLLLNRRILQCIRRVMESGEHCEQRVCCGHFS